MGETETILFDQKIKYLRFPLKRLQRCQFHVPFGWENDKIIFFFLTHYTQTPVTKIKIGSGTKRLMPGNGSDFWSYSIRVDPKTNILGRIFKLEHPPDLRFKRFYWVLTIFMTLVTRPYLVNMPPTEKIPFMSSKFISRV